MEMLFLMLFNKPRHYVNSTLITFSGASGWSGRAGRNFPLDREQRGGDS